MVAMTFKTSVSLSLKQQNLKLFFSVLMAKFKIQEKHFSKVTNLAKINRKNSKLEPDVISRTQKSKLFKILSFLFKIERFAIQKTGIALPRMS
jgi:hypothetical protein